jgi:Nucleotide modification associated domain 3
MKIILSRKGFDSSCGGKPSPIFPDGRMVSLPIPDNQSPIRYGDIRWQEHSLGSLVDDLTDGHIPASHPAHLDPDINGESLPRHPEWRPIFGQAGAAQGHLQNNGVQAGDLFLFFGLFRQVIQVSGKLAWNSRSPLRHVLWGWLQIDQVLKVAECDLAKYVWAEYHPHCHWRRESETNNTLYVARRHLELPGVTAGELAGAGVFPQFSERLALTAPTAAAPSQWELPRWFFPDEGQYPLTYHSNMARWQRTENGTRLKAVSRGQEFILNTRSFPEAEAIGWLKMLLEST